MKSMVCLFILLSFCDVITLCKQKRKNGKTFYTSLDGQLFHLINKGFYSGMKLGGGRGKLFDTHWTNIYGTIHLMEKCNQSFFGSLWMLMRNWPKK